MLTLVCCWDLLWIFIRRFLSYHLESHVILGQKPFQWIAILRLVISEFLQFTQIDRSHGHRTLDDLHCLQNISHLVHLGDFFSSKSTRSPRSSAIAVLHQLGQAAILQLKLTARSPGCASTALQLHCHVSHQFLADCQWVCAFVLIIFWQFELRAL